MRPVGFDSLISYKGETLWLNLSLSASLSTAVPAPPPTLQQLVTWRHIHLLSCVSLLNHLNLPCFFSPPRSRLQLSWNKLNSTMKSSAAILCPNKHSRTHRALWMQTNCSDRTLFVFLWSSEKHFMVWQKEQLFKDYRTITLNGSNYLSDRILRKEFEFFRSVVIF